MSSCARPVANPPIAAPDEELGERGEAGDALGGVEASLAREQVREAGEVDAGTAVRADTSRRGAAQRAGRRRRSALARARCARAARQETSETVDMVIRRVRESVEGDVSRRAFSRDDSRLASRETKCGDVAG